MNVHLDSVHAKRKMFLAALLLGLFALPFALQWHAVALLNDKSVLAGGAMLSTSSNLTTAVAPASNNVEQMSTAAGSSFTGVLAQ